MKKLLAILILISVSKPAHAESETWTRQVSAVYTRPGYTVIAYPDGRVEAFATDTRSGRHVIETFEYDPGQTNPPDPKHRLGPAVTITSDSPGLLREIPLDGLPENVQDVLGGNARK
ncbi:MAG: hypothetical protein HGB18_04620 [Candidatus Moranbacteria bacterium]|nr:hypothetical protein [Candidatus Moranbacteria bacterium]